MEINFPACAETSARSCLSWTKSTVAVGPLKVSPVESENPRRSSPSIKFALPENGWVLKRIRNRQVAAQNSARESPREIYAGSFARKIDGKLRFAANGPSVLNA